MIAQASSRWLIRGHEAFHGRKTFSYARELERTQWLAREELEARQVESLRRLLEHAARHCAYYQEAWARAALDPNELGSLEDFGNWPLIDRETIRVHRQQMRSAVHPRLIKKATGGSSGAPLEFDLDHDSNDRRMAAWHRGYGWAGAAVGTKQWYLWGGAHGHPSRRKRLKDDLYHRLYRRRVANCFHLTDDRLEEYVRSLNQYRPDAIVAYTNPLYTLARAAEERGLRVYSPRSIVVGAEKLYDFQRELIERVFRAPVFETYGSREFMLIGAECERHAGLHLTAENLLVEVVDDNGHATREGEEGNVVITDLTNYGMPFVRYVNGDRATAGFAACDCGRGLPVLRKVVGRRLDMLETPDGRRVPGEFFPHLIKDFSAIRRFQVVQESLDEIKLRLVTRDGWSAADRESLVEQIRAVVGECVKLSVDVVDDIPLTAAGKLRVVVNRVAQRDGLAATHPST